jgi:hypothetical protein
MKLYYKQFWNINNIFSSDVFFYELSILKNVSVENHGLSSGIDIVSYVINQPLKLCWIQPQMGGAYNMLQHEGLNAVP